MRLSVSQIKAFMKSPSQRAWQNILGIRDVIKNDAFNIGKAFHHFAQTWNEAEAIELLNWCEDLGLAVKKYDCLMNNYKEMWLVTTWQNEVKFNTVIFWIPFIWYIDNLDINYINEYKSTSSLSTPEDKPLQRQAVNNHEEYALQSWIYMKALNRNEVRLIEVLNKDTTIKANTTLKKEDIISCCEWFNEADSKLTKKDIIAKYKPKKPSSQIIIFKMTEEFDNEMTKKYRPIIEEMHTMYSKFKK